MVSQIGSRGPCVPACKSQWLALACIKGIFQWIFGTSHFVLHYEGLLSLELYRFFLSCPLFRVSVIGGSTILHNEHIFHWLARSHNHNYRHGMCSLLVPTMGTQNLWQERREREGSGYIHNLFTHTHTKPTISTYLQPSLHTKG